MRDADSPGRGIHSIGARECPVNETKRPRRGGGVVSKMPGVAAVRGYRQRVVIKKPMKAMPKPMIRFHSLMPGIGKSVPEM